MAKIETTLQQILETAKKKGADAAEVVLTQSTGLSASVREGAVEDITQGTSQKVVVKVFVDGKIASALAASLEKGRVNAAIEGAIRSAKTSTTPNPHARLARPDEYASQWGDLDLCDNSDADLNDLINKALEAEDAAMSVENVTIANGASAGQQRLNAYVMTSEGFSGSAERTTNYFGASVVAAKGNQKQVGGEGDRAIYAEDLKDPVEIGRKAGEDAAGKLDSIKPKSAKVPVIFAPDMAAGLLGHFAAAINGHNVSLKQTFLSNSMGKKVFADNISIVNDPTIRRGIGSEPFDNEGFATKRAVMIEDGTLQRWFMDIEDAGKLGLKPEGVSGTGNLHMLAGDISPEDLMADIKDGFYVTGLMSQGANTMTGDYSRAASGFWIKDGQIAFPVSQVVIASNMRDMFREMIPANDFTLSEMRHRSIAAPTVRIPQMTVSGS